MYEGRFLMLGRKTSRGTASSSRRLWVGLAVCAAAAGCSLDEVDSDAIRTEGMYADIRALASGDLTTVVRVDLTVGGDNGTTVHLVGDDQLTASAGGPPGVLSRVGRGRYELRMSGDAAREIVVELARGPEDAGASATAQMPEPFVVALETDSRAGISRGEAVTLNWAPPVAGGRVAWSVEGRCVWSESGVTPDDGNLVLPPEAFRVRGTRVGEDCDVVVTLERRNEGRVDPVLVPGSKFVALQRRAVSFVSTPAPDEAGGSTETPDGGS